MFAGQGDFREGQRAKFIFGGAQFYRRVEGLIPFDGLPAVGRFAAHDPRQGAFSDGPGFIDRFAGANAADQVGVLLLVGIRVLAAKTPVLPAFDQDDIVAIAGTLGADHRFLDLAIAIIHLPALAEHPDTVFILVLDRKMVVNMAVILIGAGLATAQAVSADRVTLEHPVDDVEIVDVLFDNMVSGKPGKIIPIAELPFHVRPAGLTFDHPDDAAIPISAAIKHLTDGAILQALDGFVIAEEMAALCPGGNAQTLLSGQFTRFNHQPHSRSVHRGWFFDESMLARFDGGAQMEGRKCGGVARMT